MSADPVRPTLRVVLIALNARFAHSGLAARCLRQYARTALAGEAVELEIWEQTVHDPLLSQLEALCEKAADLYAFSCYIWNINRVRALTRELRRVQPQARIVWGGPEATGHHGANPDRADCPDWIIIGEGEVPLAELVRGVIDKREADLTRTEPLPGTWPFPYEAGELEKNRDRILYYESSRGCPFRCAYCLSSCDRDWRSKPLDAVFQELDHFQNAGVRLVKFVDRTFNIDSRRARAIWRRLIDTASSSPARWHFEIAADLLDDEDLSVLRSAPPGLFQFEIGVQSTDPAVLAAVNRLSDLERLFERCARLRQAGNIHLHLDLIAGLPGEDRTGVLRGVDRVFAVLPHAVQLGFLKILPGTPMVPIARSRAYAWLGEPPYEVLYSDALTFSDLAELRKIAAMIDWYWNGGHFQPSLQLLMRELQPSSLFAGLAGEAASCGYFDRSLSFTDRARALWQYGLAQAKDQAAWRAVFESDYRAAGQKHQPDWLSAPVAL